MVNLRLEYGPDEKPPYAFCESVHAASLSPWHIRKTTNTGLHLGGAIDTDSLCKRVTAHPWGGWDLSVRITEDHLNSKHVCAHCVAVYKDETRKSP